MRENKKWMMLVSRKWMMVASALFPYGGDKQRMTSAAWQTLRADREQIQEADSCQVQSQGASPKAESLNPKGPKKMVKKESECLLGIRDTHEAKVSKQGPEAWVWLCHRRALCVCILCPPWSRLDCSRDPWANPWKPK